MLVILVYSLLGRVNWGGGENEKLQISSMRGFKNAYVGCGCEKSKSGVIFVTGQRLAW